MGIATYLTDYFQNCIDTLTRSAQVCLECFDACLNKPDVEEKKNKVNVADFDCRKYINNKNISTPENSNYADATRYYHNCMRAKGFTSITNCNSDPVEKPK